MKSVEEGIVRRGFVRKREEIRQGSYLAKWPRPRRVLVISRGLTRIYEENANSSVAVHRLILLRRRKKERREGEEEREEGKGEEEEGKKEFRESRENSRR